MTNDFFPDAPDIITHIQDRYAIELERWRQQMESLDRRLRAMEGWKANVASGDLIRATQIQGVVPVTNGGSGTVASTLGAVTIWNNNSGGTLTQGAVVVRNGNRLFTTTTNVADVTTIGVLTDASVGNGVDGHVCHAGYVALVTVQGAVTAGHYLQSSATAGAATDAGAGAIIGAFAVALTGAAGPGAGTVAAYVFPVLLR